MYDAITTLIVKGIHFVHFKHRAPISGILSVAPRYKTDQWAGVFFIFKTINTVK